MGACVFFFPLFRGSSFFGDIFFRWWCFCPHHPANLWMRLAGVCRCRVSLLLVYVVLYVHAHHPPPPPLLPPPPNNRVGWCLCFSAFSLLCRREWANSGPRAWGHGARILTCRCCWKWTCVERCRRCLTDTLPSPLRRGSRLRLEGSRLVL